VAIHQQKFRARFEAAPSFLIAKDLHQTYTRPPGLAGSRETPSLAARNSRQDAARARQLDLVLLTTASARF